MRHEHYMHRCIQLALLGKGFVAPNPLVGAVLVYDDIIIGEGYHQQYGQAHAEVNCINICEDPGQMNSQVYLLTLQRSAANMDTKSSQIAAKLNLQMELIWKNAR